MSNKNLQDPLSELCGCKENKKKHVVSDPVFCSENIFQFRFLPRGKSKKSRTLFEKIPKKIPKNSHKSQKKSYKSHKNIKETSKKSHKSHKS